jgi:hypothetical protein
VFLVKGSLLPVTLTLTPRELEQLVRELASLYPDTADAIVVAQHTGIQNYATNNKAIITWNSVINEAHKQGKIIELIERTQRDYPENPSLGKFYQEFLNRRAKSTGEDVSVDTTDDTIQVSRRFRIPKVIILFAIIIPLILAPFLLGFLKDDNTSPKVTLTFDAFRDPLIYHVSLHDAPPAGTQFIVGPNSNRYIFYSTYVKYKRTPTRGAAKMLITAITNSSSYAQWVRTNDVVYREIIGVDPADKPAFDALIRRIDDAQTSRDKLTALYMLMEVEFRVDGLLLELEDFRREPFGFVLSYKNPMVDKPSSSATYEFTCKTFQSRAITNFPFIVSELSRNVDYKLDYSGVTVDTPEYFSAFLYNPLSNPDVSNDAVNKVLTVRTRGGEWVYPGGGIILYWK